MIESLLDNDEFQIQRIYRPEDWMVPDWLHVGRRVWVWGVHGETRKLLRYKIVAAFGDAGWVEPDYEGCESQKQRLVGRYDMLVLRYS